MSEVATSVMEEALLLGPLLGEYAGKLWAFNDQTASFLEEGNDYMLPRRAAWLLDQFDAVRTPLLRVQSRASQLVEHADLSTTVHEIMALRLNELDAQFHHAIRLAHELRERVRTSKWESKVAPLRMAAGLNGMKGGPLRPN